MKQKHIIRKAKKADLVQIVKLYNSDKTMKGFDSSVSLYSAENIKEYMGNKHNLFLVCEYNGKIIGACLIEIHADYLFLHTVIISKKHREKGIGTKFMDRVKKECIDRKLRSIELFTEKSNYAMQLLLDKQDYLKGKEYYFYQFQNGE